MGNVRLYRHEIFLGASLPGGTSDDAFSSLTEVAHWLEHYVSRPHPAVGRAGDVCPWTRQAGKQGDLLLTHCSEHEPPAIDTLLLSLRDQLIGDTAGFYDGPAFRSIITIFPERGAAVEARVVAAHRRLKPAFLAQRLMLGEFYPSCDKPGLHNAAFRPLRAPSPLLVIRPMVEADLDFLLDRDEFVNAYLRAHERRGAARLERLLRDQGTALATDRIAELWQVLRS